MQRIIEWLGGDATLTQAFQTVAAVLASLVALIGLIKYWRNRNRRTTEDVVRDAVERAVAQQSLLFARLLEARGVPVSMSQAELLASEQTQPANSATAHKTDADGIVSALAATKLSRMKLWKSAFVLSAKEDTARAVELADQVAATQIKPFLPGRDIQPGQRWQEGISAALANTDVVLILWSAAAAGSESVRQEIGQVVEEYMRRKTGPRPLSVQLVRLDEAPLPDALSQFQFQFVEKNKIGARMFGHHMTSLTLDPPPDVWKQTRR